MHSYQFEHAFGERVVFRGPDGSRHVGSVVEIIFTGETIKVLLSVEKSLYGSVVTVDQKDIIGTAPEPSETDGIGPYAEHAAGDTPAKPTPSGEGNEEEEEEE